MKRERMLQIWYIADEIHRLTHIQGPPYNPENLVKLLGGEVKRLKRYELSQLGFNENFISQLKIEYSKDLKQSSFTILIAADKPEEQVKFSVASNLGDLILHFLKAGGELALLTDAQLRYAESDREVESNEFAAAFLMPTDLFMYEIERNCETHNGYINIVELAKNFGVTTSAVQVRGQRLSLW